MYSGINLKPLRRFDAWFGAHQKIDRVARQHLRVLLPKGRDFPVGREITRFEGIDGPDGIKLKTPAQDELWHFMDPENEQDRQIIDVLEHNYRELVKALKEGNQARAAFEASWLAHGIVDGLTPAHHYPYEEELIRLRGGEGIETRTSAKEKVFMPGATLPKRLSNNWQMWGDKGLLATHIAFEMGVAVMIWPLRFSQARPTEADLKEATDQGLAQTFVKQAKEIAALRMYDRFYASGWTPKLARQVRRELMPRIVNMVTLAWYLAAREAYELS
jgi:hypothetical protein